MIEATRIPILEGKEDAAIAWLEELEREGLHNAALDRNVQLRVVLVDRSADPTAVIFVTAGDDKPSLTLLKSEAPLDHRFQQGLLELFDMESATTLDVVAAHADLHSDKAEWDQG